MLIVSVTTVCSVLTQSVYFKGFEGKPVSKFIQFIFFKIISRLIFVWSKIKSENLFIICFELQFKDFSKEINEEISIIRRKIDALERNFIEKDLEINNRDCTPNLLKENNQTVPIVITSKIFEENDSQHSKSFAINESIWRMKNEGKDMLNKEKLPREIRMRKSLSNVHQDLRILRTSQDSNQTDQNELIKLISKFTKYLQKSQMKYDQIEDKRGINNQWRLLSEVVDRLLLYIFIFSTFIVLFVILNQAPNAKLI